MINSHSSKIVQTLYKFSYLSIKFQISEVAHNNIVSLTKNKNGYYMILVILDDFVKMLQKIDYNDKNLIIDLKEISRLPNDIPKEISRFHKKIMKNFNEIVVDKYGCCFIQNYYNSFNINSLEVIKQNILDATILSIPSFLKQKYAHFLLTFFLNKNSHKFFKTIIEIISFEYKEYFCNEISYKVIEKLIDSEIDCSLIIYEFLKNDVSDIVFNSYGQKCKFFLIF